MNQGVGKTLYVAGVTTFCTFLGCWAVLAHQENSPARQVKQSEHRGNAPYSDENFVRLAAEGSMAQVKLGELAEQKGQSEEVKGFAKRMVEDHAKTTGELKELGAREGINLPTDTSSKHAEVYERLSKLSGPEFDRAYAQDVVKDHEKDIAEFKRGVSTAQKPALKQFAQQTLPMLESHLEKAKEMMAHVSHEGVSKSRTGGAGHQR